MAFYLEVQPDGFFRLNTFPAFHTTSTDTWEWEVDIAAPATSNNFRITSSFNGTAEDGYLLITSTGITFRRSSGTASEVVFSNTIAFDSTVHNVRIVGRSANDYELFINGSSVETSTVNTGTGGDRTMRNLSNSADDTWHLYRLRFRDSENGTLLYDWNADSASSNGTGTTLYDDASGNNGTFNGTINWVEYGAGGTISVTGATPSFAYTPIAASVELTPEITVTGQTPSYTYTPLAGSVDLTGSIDITGATPSFAYAPVSGSVDLTGAINVTGATPSYSYSATAGAVDLTGAISVTGATPSYSYAATAGSVDLGGQISVTGQTPTVTYTSIAGEVDLTGVITVTGQTPAATYTPVSGSVVLQGTIAITGQTAQYTYAPVAGNIFLDSGQRITEYTITYAGDYVAGGFADDYVKRG